MIAIASRMLKIVDGEHGAEVLVQLFMPEEDGGAWSCAYEIGWPGEPRRFRAFGQDSMQAILLAMQIVGAELYTSSYHKAGALVLDRPGGGYGFPVPKTLGDLLEGDDRESFG